MRHETGEVTREASSSPAGVGGGPRPLGVRAPRAAPLLRRILARALAIVLPPRLMKDKAFFSLWERRGYHVTLVDPSGPIPDTRQLGEELWNRPSECVGIDFNEVGQLKLLAELASSFKEEYDLLPRSPTGRPFEFFLENPFFGAVDAELLYSMIRFRRPRNVVEVGSGYSTYLIAQGIRRNRKDDPAYACRFTTIDPQIEPGRASAIPELSEVVEGDVQRVPLARFDELAENDVLFIDSSHVLRIGSDVQHEYLEILPRLQAGVLVHAHDIFLPLEYPRSWIMRHSFPTEQYLLQAFLAFNESFRLLWAGHFMSLRHPERLEEAFASFRRDETAPGSVWITRVR